MIKRKTKVIAIVILICTCCMLNKPKLVEAQSSYNCVDSSRNVFAIEMAEKYNSSYNDNNFETKVYLSQPYFIVNGDDCYAYFLFKGNTCVGIMNVVSVEGEYCSSFTHSNLPVLDFLLENGDEFIVITDGQNLYARTIDGDLLHILGLSERNGVGIPVNCRIEYQNVELTRIDNLPNTRSQYCLLNVPIVANASSPDTGDGICWAAAMASIIMYRTGISGLSAIDEYNLLKMNYYPTYYGYPDGGCIWIERCFSNHSLSYTHAHSGTYYDNIKQIVEVHGRPVYCWLTRTGGAHSVVINGFDSGYGYYNYKIMDPNVDSIVTVQVTNTAATSFIYISSYGYTYTGWECHMY